MSFEHPRGDVCNTFGKVEIELGTTVRNGICGVRMMARPWERRDH